jgi:spore maturation protein CgeB
MKILHIAVFKPESSNVWQANGFEALGHQVYRFDYRQVAVELGSDKARDIRAIEVCNNYQPDIILFSKCNKMHVRVVEECNKVGTTALWYMDNFHNLDQEVRSKMKECNYVFCSTRRSCNVATLYNSNVSRLTGGFDPTTHRPMNLYKSRDVLFIGSMHSNRPIYQKAVGFPVVHGVYNEEHCRLVNETKVNINITEGDGVSNRIYKIMGAGGFLLTNPWDEILEDFVPDVDLATFTSPEEMKAKINYYVNNDEERDKIALNGYIKAKKRDNIYYARRIIETCKH